MGWYARHLFPYILERILASPQLDALRREALAEAHGEVLEIGFGTGLNLPAYSHNVSKLVAVDSEFSDLPGLQNRLAQTHFPIEFYESDATKTLPFDDAQFQCIVTTWTLCSLVNPESTLREIARILAPGGHYFFLEHGQSPLPKIQRYQNWLAPIYRLLACGCCPNRPIPSLIQNAELRIDRLREVQVPRLGKAASHVFLGMATRLP